MEEKFVLKEEFIKREFPSRYQVDETNIWYEYPYHSKLFSPEYIKLFFRRN